MTVRNIKKSLAGVEDIATGIGTLQQERGIVHRVNVFPSSYKYIEMQQYEGGDFFRLYGSDLSYTDYRRNPAGTLGIPAGAGGVWEPLTSNDKTIGGNTIYGAYLADDTYLVWHAASNSNYAWTGSFPHTVAPGTDPTMPGGIGDGAWVARTDVTLRSKIFTVETTHMSVSEAILDKSLQIGDNVRTLSYIAGNNTGGNDYIVVAGGTGAVDGGRYINLSNGLQLKGLFLDGKISVSRFGAYGNWNTQTQTGNDDTTAWQNAINSLGNTYRNGGYRRLHIDTGNFKLSTLTIPASLGFGLLFSGEGKYASTVWGDNSSGLVINSEIEFVHFDSMTLYGTLQESNLPANWVDCFYKGKLSSGAPDIDVTFTNCTLGYAKDFVQAYGRGVVVDNTCTCVQMLYLLNIVCDASTVFDAGSTNNKYQTGMRNYKLNPARADLVSRLFRVTGSAVQKDYINDISAHGVDATGLDLIGEFPDATITQLYVSGVTALDSFAQGMLIGKRIIGADIEANASKSFNRDAVSVSYITGLVNLTGSFQNLKIKGTYRDLCRRVVNIGAESNGLDIDIKVNNIGMDGVNFIAVTGANVIGAKIDIFASGNAPVGTLAFVAPATQTSPKIIANGHGFNFARAGAGDTPVLYIGSIAQTPGYAATRYNLEKGKVIAEIAYFYTRAAATSSAVTLSLPPVTPVAEFPLLSSGISGMAIIKYSNIKTLVKCEISPATGRVVFYKADGSSLLESDLPATFTVVVHAEYPYI